MKKIFNIISKILVILLIIGAFIFNYFALHKMGMSRHVYYMNTKYSNMFSLSFVNTMILIVSLVFIVLAIYRLRNNRLNKFYFDKVIFILAMIVLFYVELFLNYKSTPAYYFICYMLEFAVIIESIRIILIGRSIKN